MGQREYLGKTVGFAKIMADVDISDGTAALEIVNFHANDAGYLDNTFRLMPLIPNAWRGGDQPAAFQDAVLAMAFGLMYGETPELLFLTTTGVFRYAPWRRASGGTNPGLVEELLWSTSGSESVTPQDSRRYPPQIEVVGNRYYFTYCDGGGAWVWDGHRIRPFGYTARPQPPYVEGPQRDEDGNPNNGGFNALGRIGTIETGWVDPTSKEIVGGIDVGRWQYWAAFEGTDGAYSGTSAAGGIATIRVQMADPDNGTMIEDLRKRIRLNNLPQGPLGTAALILLRSRNLDRLPDGDDGAPRFLHRLPGNYADEWIDDIPDGELGAAWVHREPVPAGIYFLRSFGGSMWMLRTDGNPARGWWSEQEGLNGPIPESILEGHWRDIFADTGPITGSIVARLRNETGTPAMLVFKESATHFVTGQYPRWEFGTLHSRAGLAGPGLVQNCPDGTVVWYGARTFWQMREDGTVVDIGQGVRRRLGRINSSFAHMGHSWVDIRRGEVVYKLPIDDSDEPNFGFVYDSRMGGMRLLDDVVTTCSTVIPGTDIVLVAGTFDSVTTVFAYGRGYQLYETPNPVSRYSTAWTSFAAFGPSMHSSFNLRDSVLTLSERSDGTATYSTLQDWNDDDRTAVDPVHCAHPEQDDIAFFDPGATEAAVYGESLWRSRRAYTERHAVDEASHTVFRLEVETDEPMAIISIDAYGPKVAGPGGRSPQPDAED
jgi:hypothetical protein